MRRANASPLLDPSRRAVAWLVVSDEDLLRLARDEGAFDERLERAARGRAEHVAASYDFFFGGGTRRFYPDDEEWVQGMAALCRAARRFGLGFGASAIHPLDLGPGWVERGNPPGGWVQVEEYPVCGSFCVEAALERVWFNNKGPFRLTLAGVRALAFREERLGETGYYLVRPDWVREARVESFGEEGDRLRVRGQAPPGCDRLVLLVRYTTPELDYFHPGTGDYVEEVLRRHKEAGLDYTCFHADETHAVYSWDQSRIRHGAPCLYYLTRNMAERFRELWGEADLERALLYFPYHAHDRLPPPHGEADSQHVLGPGEEGIARTWLLRSRYYDLFSRGLVDFCIEALERAERLWGRRMLVPNHATWEESPTCDRFGPDCKLRSEQAPELYFPRPPAPGESRYDLTPLYEWGSSRQEYGCGCFDYFRMNDFLTGGYTDMAEEGYTDANYYAAALTVSLGRLSRLPSPGMGMWGSPPEVCERMRRVAVCHGLNVAGSPLAHVLGGLRSTPVLALYPLDLHPACPRFGAWMVQYGYCDYITEEKLLEHERRGEGTLEVAGAGYKALFVPFSPLPSLAFMGVVWDFVASGGILLWAGPPALLLRESGAEAGGAWSGLVGCEAAGPLGGRVAADAIVEFRGILSGVPPMRVPTAFFPDQIYPVRPLEGAEVVAVVRLGGEEIPVGTVRRLGEGVACYLGLRPRDDQSRSTGEEVATLFHVLCALGAYDPDGVEVLSRSGPYLFTRFPSGTVACTRHSWPIRQTWVGSWKQDHYTGRLPEETIVLEGAPVAGSRVTCTARGVLAWRLKDGRLEAFWGEGVTGFGADGVWWSFCKEPATVAFAPLAPDALAPGVGASYILYVAEEGEYTFPVRLEAPGETELFCEGERLPEVQELPEGLRLRVPKGGAGRPLFVSRVSRGGGGVW